MTVKRSCCLRQLHPHRTVPPLSQTITGNMIDIDAEQQAVETSLDHLTDALDVLQDALQPLTQLPDLHHPPGDSAAKLSLFTICSDYIHLPALEQARLYAALAYTLASLNHIQLSLAGENAAPSATPPAANNTPQQGVKRELERIKRYMMTIEKVAKGDEDATTADEPAPSPVTVTSNKSSKQHGKQQHKSKIQRSGDKRKQTSDSAKKSKHVKL